YVNSQIKYKTRCLKCNFEWYIKPNDVFNGHGCSSCAQVKRLTYEEVKNRYDILNIELLSEYYINIKQKLKLKCKICEYIWMSTMMNTDKGRGCPKCGITRRKEKRRENLKNKRFGRLTVLEHTDKNNRVYWNCLCECGNIKNIKKVNLMHHKTKHCGCLNKDYSMVGKKFGRLEVLEQAPSKIGTCWKCKCDCGTIKVIQR
ncbi:MAG: hypothetical protein AABY22_12340, partial [Nanoarchaeota archaeon]